MNNKVKFLRGTAAEYANAVKDDDTFYYTTDDEKFYVGSKEITGGSITIDDALSDTSEHPVQNKIVKKAIDEKADKTVATTTADGLMSAEDKTKLDDVDDTYALKSKYGDSTINVGRKAGTTVGKYSTAEGNQTTASGESSHTEGFITEASASRSHAEGERTTASGVASHAEGYNTTASGNYSHAEGESGKKVISVIPDFSSSTSIDDIITAWKTSKFSLAKTNSSHAEGYSCLALSNSSHAEGNTTISSGYFSHAEGNSTTASGGGSHAEGGRTTASGSDSHAEGNSTTASSDCSHAEGQSTKASGNFSHAEGYCTTASGRYSHAGGSHTEALKESEFAHGKYNQSNDDTLFSIGDGTADDARHNAFEITTTGGKLHDKDIATTDLIPTTLPANGGNADTVNGHTVNSDVPANALFTDTINSDITASGNPVQLDGLQGGVPFNRVSVSGDDVIGREMTVGVCGRNLLTYPYSKPDIYTTKTCTFTVNSGDKSVSITATDAPVGSAIYHLKTKTDFYIPAGTYTVSGCPVGGAVNKYRVDILSADSQEIACDYGDGTTFTIDHMQPVYIRIYIYGGFNPDGLVFYPQLELGDTATDYEPYHGASYTITPDRNPYTVPVNITQYDGINVLSIADDSNPTISVSGTRENLAIKRIWDNISMDLLFDGITDESNPAMFDLTGYNVIEIHHIIVSTEKVCPIVIRMSIDNYLATPSTIINSICESSVSTVHNENGNISSLYAVLADGSAMTNTKIYGIK